MNKKIISLILYIIIIAVALLFDFKLAYFQMIAFPFFLFALWFVFKSYLPKTVVYGSCFLCAFGIVKNFEFLNTNTDNFYIARFEEDSFEAKTTLLRKRVNAYLKDDEISLKRYFGSFSNLEEVNKFLKDNEKIKGIIWAGKRSGETQDLYLTMPVVRPSVVSSFVSDAEIIKNYYKEGLTQQSLEKFSKIISEVRIFENAPLVDMPSSLRKGGAAYLAELIRGVALNSEMNLAYASKILSKWNISDHLVFARFMLGNLYLKSFFSNGFSEISTLECALNYYNSAKRLSNLLPNKKLFYATLEYNRLVSKIILNFHKKNLEDFKEVKTKIKLLVELLGDIKLENEELKLQAKRVLEQSKYLITVISKLKKQIIKKNDGL